MGTRLVSAGVAKVLTPDLLKAAALGVVRSEFAPVHEKIRDLRDLVAGIEKLEAQDQAPPLLLRAQERSSSLEALAPADPIAVLETMREQTAAAIEETADPLVRQAFTSKVAQLDVVLASFKN